MVEQSNKRIMNGWLDARDVCLHNTKNIRGFSIYWLVFLVLSLDFKLIKQELCAERHTHAYTDIFGTN